MERCCLFGNAAEWPHAPYSAVCRPSEVWHRSLFPPETGERTPRGATYWEALPRLRGNK